ncbi:MAG: AAA family ATPase [Anaerolineae bacterium]|nr:AAA family ATPase [Anaerolineae bacterium]
MSTNSPSAYSLVSLGEFGERARSLHGDLREVALVIGLGQVGLLAVAQLHTMLHVMLTRREIQSKVRLLAIARRRSIRQEIILPREERLMPSMDSIGWGDVPGRYAQLGVAQWWPHSPRLRDILEDPSHVRAYNRLLLFDNAALISEALFKLSVWHREVGVAQNLKLTRRIYVLASLSEAESSSMIFDIVSRLRLLANQDNKPTEIIGVFSLSHTGEEQELAHAMSMANVYATLREIDNYTLHPDTFVSSLPVIGHSLTRSKATRALDMILLADDAASPPGQPPENILAECVTTWIGASLTPKDWAVNVPAPIPHDEGVDRFQGYSTIGISKLALPIRAAMDLAAVGLAQSTLSAIKSTHANTATTGWSSQIVQQARRALLDVNLLQASDVANRMREWSYDLSAAGLNRHLETRAAKGESGRMVDLTQNELNRLEREALNESQAGPATVSAQPDSLRTRIDTALAVTLQSVHDTLTESPVDLAYGKGFGLIWTVSAFEELARRVKDILPELNNLLTEAKAAVQLSRHALFESAQQVDSRSGSRFSGSRKAITAELDARAEAALNAFAEMIVAQAQIDAWRQLITLVENLRDDVRETIPLVEKATHSLNEFETTCRHAMEQAVYEPSGYPVVALVTEEWYTQGTQRLSSLGQMAPSELLQQVYRSWSPGSLVPERRLNRFLMDVRDAARRALMNVFSFADLYEFLEQNQDNKVFKQAVSGLAASATPALVPTNGDTQATTVPYEIVREMTRPTTIINSTQPGVYRIYVPSPDPDELTVLRILHGMMAESIPALRESYRRAYDRAGAEGMPLHIDRRWDSTMADLVHTTARREISVIWESMITALRKNPRMIEQPLDALIRSLGVALDVIDTAIIPNLPPDIRLVIFKLRPFRLKLPPPTCAVLFVHSNRSAQEVGEDLFRAVTPIPMEEQFVFVVNVNGRRDMDQVVEPLRRVDFTVLVLSEADIKHLISARMPTRALSDLVLSHVDLNTVSPFYTRGPVPEHMFFGREREINVVRSKLRTHSVALIGGRRIGKTSTLQRIQRLLGPTESEYVPYYLDCHGATQYKSFFWLINRRWQVEVYQDANPVEFEDVVTELQKRHPGKNIAILFDEIDSLLEYDRHQENQETLFRTLRSLSNEKRCQYVFSGEKWLMRAITNPYSALFNFTQAVRLEPLPPKVVHHLVADPFEMLNIWMEESDQIIDRIYEISAGHPNIVQMICQAMIEELDKDGHNTNLLNYEHLDRATARRQLQEEIVQTIWGQMNPLARLITLLWPEGERFLTLAQIEQQLRSNGINSIPPDRLERTARDLELYCFVRQHGNDRLELIPMAFPAILDFMTDKRRQLEIVRRQYEMEPEGGAP